MGKDEYKIRKHRSNGLGLGLGLRLGEIFMLNFILGVIVGIIIGVGSMCLVAVIPNEDDEEKGEE